MTPARLRELLTLAAARKARDLARLEGLAAQRRALEVEIAEALAALAADMAEPEPLPLTQQGLRIAWADARIAAARRAQAALAAALAEARTEAVRSLGKHRALEHLLERAEKASAATADAKAEREAPPREPRSRSGSKL